MKHMPNQSRVANDQCLDVDSNCSMHLLVHSLGLCKCVTQRLCTCCSGACLRIYRYASGITDSAGSGRHTSSSGAQASRAPRPPYARRHGVHRLRYAVGEPHQAWCAAPTAAGGPAAAARRPAQPPGRAWRSPQARPRPAAPAPGPPMRPGGAPAQPPPPLRPPEQRAKRHALPVQAGHETTHVARAARSATRDDT